jgi:hypothetical protein
MTRKIPQSCPYAGRPMKPVIGRRLGASISRSLAVRVAVQDRFLGAPMIIYLI